jgi:beta-phosphoglucomutase-like phosphatase (HAD superfamily)
VFEDSVAGVQAANIGNMTSIGIGEASTLHEAKYIFKDFTAIDTLHRRIIKNKTRFKTRKKSDCM